MNEFKQTVLPAAKVFLGLWLICAAADQIGAGGNPLGIVVTLVAVGAWGGYAFGKFVGKETKE